MSKFTGTVVEPEAGMRVQFRCSHDQAACEAGEPVRFVRTDDGTVFALPAVDLVKIEEGETTP
jgi:hypothetical protein